MSNEITKDAVKVAGILPESLYANAPSRKTRKFLLFGIYVVSFFANPVHGIRGGPWAFFGLLVYYTRTSLLSKLTFFHLIFSTWMSLLLYTESLFSGICAVVAIAFVVLGFMLDRWFFQSTIAWAAKTFRRPFSRSSFPLIFVLFIRVSIVCLFLPFFCSTLFALMGHIQSPLGVIGLADFSVTTVNSDFRVLASFGGQPLLGFVIVYAASVTVGLLLAYKIVSRGMTKWEESILQTDGQQPPHHLDNGLTSSSSPGSHDALILDVHGHEMKRMLLLRNQAKSTFGGIGRLFMWCTAPYAVVLLLLASTGPTIRVLRGRFSALAILKSQDTRLAPTVRIGCVSSVDFDEYAIARAALAGVDILLSSASNGVSTERAAQLARSSGMLICNTKSEESIRSYKGGRREVMELFDRQGTVVMQHLNEHLMKPALTGIPAVTTARVVIPGIGPHFEKKLAKLSANIRNAVKSLPDGFNGPVRHHRPSQGVLDPSDESKSTHRGATVDPKNTADSIQQKPSQNAAKIKTHEHGVVAAFKDHTIKSSSTAAAHQPSPSTTQQEGTAEQHQQESINAHINENANVPQVLIEDPLAIEVNNNSNDNNSNDNNSAGIPSDVIGGDEGNSDSQNAAHVDNAVVHTPDTPVVHTPDTPVVHTPDTPVVHTPDT
eukprot:Lankesteria_metandrocarpae@DN4728_c0_g1_i2.p1